MKDTITKCYLVVIETFKSFYSKLSLIRLNKQDVVPNTKHVSNFFPSKKTY